MPSLAAMPAPRALDSPVTLLVGPETLLAERAIAAVIAAARAADDEADVSEVAGADLTAAALAEHVSPSLFATRRVLVVRGVQDVADPTAQALTEYAALPVVDVHVVLVHPGGPKGKRLLDDLRSVGVREVGCERVTRPDDQVDFVRSEIAAGGGRIDESAARRLVEAVGGDLRGLASAAAQLAADAEGGVVDAAVVATYFEGRAEVKGWVVADRAVEGRTVDALEQLRWALETGTDPVLVTAALATAVRSLARLAGAPRGVRDADLARDLGVPPWKVRILRGQLRGWTPRVWCGRSARSPRPTCGSRAAATTRLWRSPRPSSRSARPGQADPKRPTAPPMRDGAVGRGAAAQRAAARLAIADFRLAAWFLWMTPFEAALSSLRAASRASVVACSESPASAAVVEPAHGGLQGGLDPLVAQPCFLVGEDALLLGLDVRH